MLDWLKFQRASARFNAALRRTERMFAEERKATKGNKEFDEAGSRDQENFELRMIQEDMALFETRYLLKKAYRYGLPIPYDDHQAWDDVALSGPRILKREAMGKMRAAIRKEESERWELRLKVIGALTGLIGTLIGLIAMLKK